MSSSAEVAWKRVRDIKPVVVAHRAEADELRRLPEPIAKAFLEADIYRFHVPADLGGLGLDPLTTYDLIEEMASYDGSAGWNFAIGMNGAAMCGGFPTAWLKQHFSTPNCGVGLSGAAGRAIPAPGGYRLSGHWSYASGFHEARLVAGFGVVMAGDAPRMKPQGGPDARLFFMPREQVTWVDAWRTGGMRGTGSTDFETADVFVPEEDTAYAFTGQSEYDAPIFRLPPTFFGLGLSAVSLGVARGAIEGLKALSDQAPEAYRSQGYLQYAMAKATALHGAAHAYVHASFAPIWANVVTKTPHAPEQKAQARAAYVHAMESAKAAVELCVEAAGGQGVYENRPFARALRDVHAIGAHIVLARRTMETAGQALLGMPVNNPLF